ncbi:MAG: PH domain-containing protein [Candidatus Daviesbacteria bacterium]|nr:PH domain-containing protein [Candidatus Daviesbacteria bacterium]
MAKLHYQEAITEKEKKAFEKFLAEDEELILATGFGSVYLRSVFMQAILWPGIIFWIIGLASANFLQINLGYGLLVGLIFSCLVAFLKSTHAYHANRYLLTTRRVIIKRGVFAVSLTSALYDKITHIEVIQSFIDKLFYHLGNIIINTAGTNKDEIVLKYVDYPVEFKNLLERMINREREQYGGRGGSVTTIEGELVD